MSRFASRSLVARALLIAALPCFVPLAARADPKDDVQSAVQKLDEAKSYSWSSTVTGGGGGGGNSSGKTETGGYTSLSMTMRDNTVAVVIKGDKAAVQTEDGWKSSEELADAEGPTRYLGMIAKNYKTPVQQMDTLLKDVPSFTKGDDGTYSADLSEASVKKLLARGGRRRNNNGGGAAGGGGSGPQISNAKGDVKFLLADGALSKMVLHVSGTMTTPNGDRDIDRTTTTEITEVDKTTVDVPAEAKAKIEEPAAAPATAPATP